MPAESHKTNSRRRWRGTYLLAAFLVSSCTSIYKPDNQAITFVDETSGYRRLAVMKSQAPGDTLLLLAFSGGGTRAAALSYGVMQELRDTEVDGRAGRVRLLDEVDAISSVSGGSFTAAYYGVYREQLFEDYEDVFLRQGVQQALIRKLLSPGHWIRSGFSGFDRTEMAVDYYDRTIFKGATFADMAKHGPPYIDINATDLTTGMRFTFTQELFDLICTDLSSFSVARAVTASSAVPVAFPTVVLKNHADQCDVSKTDQWRRLESAQPGSRSQEALVEGMKSYRDVEHRRYIHLVDGGIADNLGLRTLIARMEFLDEEGIGLMAEHGVKNVLLILVNAQVNPERLIEKTAKKPSASATMSAFTAAQMDRYNQETIDRLRQNIERFDEVSAERGYKMKVHFVEVSFDHVQTKEASTFLNNLPTTLELDDDEIDGLIAAGRYLLRNEPSFQAFKRTSNASLTGGAVSDEALCEYFSASGC